MNTTATISFDRPNFAEYKQLRDEAVNNKSTFFIWKNSVVGVYRASKLIKKFEVAFADPMAGETVTVPYVELDY
jgi:hypothetical protein